MDLSSLILEVERQLIIAGAASFATVNGRRVLRVSVETSVGERVASWAVSAAVMACPKISVPALWGEFFEECRWVVLSQRLPEEALIVLRDHLVRNQLWAEGVLA